MKKYFFGTLWFNSSCPLDCGYCGAKNILPIGNKSVEKWKELIEYLAPVTEEFILMGREVLLYPDLLEIINYIKNIGSTHILITSGLGDDILFKELVQNIYHHIFVMSLDGLEEKYCEDQSSFLKSLKAKEIIESGAVKAKAKLVSCVLTSKNVDHVLDLYNYCVKWGWRLTIAALIKPTNNNYRKYDPYSDYKDREYFKKAAKVFKAILSKENWWDVMGPNHEYLKTMSRLNSNIKWNCSKCRTYTILPDHSFSPCSIGINKAALMNNSYKILRDDSVAVEKFLSEYNKICGGCLSDCAFVSEYGRGGSKPI